MKPGLSHILNDTGFSANWPIHNSEKASVDEDKAVGSHNLYNITVKISTVSHIYTKWQV